MYLFTLAIICCATYGTVISSHDKCCDLDEHLEFHSKDYVCVKDVHKRFGILAPNVNFWRSNASGQCVDALGVRNVVTLIIENGTVLQAETADGKYFPKCCPLGYVYNSRKHGCTENSNPDHDFIDEPFVKVGLPDCKVIVDYGPNDNYNESYDFCIDRNETGDYIRRVCMPDTSVCDSFRCVKKCCPDGQSFVNGSHCLDTYVNGLNLAFSKLDIVEDPSDSFAVISNWTCKSFYAMSESRYNIKLFNNGTFRFWHNMSNSFKYENVDDTNSYCIEHANMPKYAKFLFFKCFPVANKEAKFKYTLEPKILSCIFLILTMAIYFVLGETRIVFGKILMNYCVSILALYSLLIYTQLYLDLDNLVCKLAGYALIFFSTVSFTWLNVMCCDIWFTFGSTKHSVGSHQRRKDMKKILIYMAYGWGAPTLLTLIVYVMSMEGVSPENIRPYVGYSKCFIDSRNLAPIIFLRVPHLLIQIVNVILFFRTVAYCLKIKNEINKINDTTKSEKRKSFQRDSERLSLIAKLAVIMGVSFMFETTSGFVKMSEMGDIMKWIEIVGDWINCLQGVFIFLIFICKKKIYKEISKKFGIMQARQTLRPQSTVTTSSARTSLMNNK